MSGDARIARARAKTGRETGQADEGVRRCVQLMSDGEWETGVTASLVAAEFGVSARTAESWAATASKVIRHSLGDPDDLRARIAVMLERHERVAMSRVGVSMAGNEYPNPDVKAATNALKTMAEVLGLTVQKHAHVHVVSQYDALPPADKARWLREQAAEMLAEADRLECVDVVPES